MFSAVDNPEFEMAPLATLQAHQDALLLDHLRYLADHSPFYRRRFAENGIDLRQIAGCSDLHRLPFTDKGDLGAAHREFLCVEPAAIVDVCLTSGTTDAPVPLLQTRRDLDRLTANEASSFRRMGIGPDDRVLIAVALDRCFMAGLAYFLGLAHLGATAIRAGASNLALLAELVRQQKPTAIIGVPTLLLALAERLQAEGIDPAATGVRRLVGIGEPVRSRELNLSPLGQRLVERWRAPLFGTYASTEMATAFSDCESGRGGHLHPALAAVEIVDEAGSPLPPGAPGEVVVTPLQVTGMPLLRFRTGDIAVLHAEPCPCGLLWPRLGPVLGRKAQMLKIRGTTVYPPAVFAVLQEFESICGYYLEVFDEYHLSDRLRVTVACRDNSLSAEAIGERLTARLRVTPEVVMAAAETVTARTMPEGKRKAVVFFDHRKTRP
ncbi:MAG: AMP-binding protein [Desulfuromonadales bacterium]